MTNQQRWETLGARAREETLDRIRADGEGAPEDVAEILEAMAEGIFDPTFDLGDLRRTLDPTAATRRRFRGHCGASFNSYLIARRLDAAQQLVSETDVPPCEIASALGFLETDLFRRWFKSWTGETPVERRAAAARSAAEDRREDAADPWPPISVWIRARVTALANEEIDRLIAIIRTRCVGAGRAACAGRRRS